MLDVPIPHLRSMARWGSAGVVVEDSLALSARKPRQSHLKSSALCSIEPHLQVYGSI